MSDQIDPMQSFQPPQQQFPRNPECEDFIDSIRNLIKDKGYDMVQMVSFQEIVQLLDNLSLPATFNKNLFHTIVTSSGFSSDSPLSLEEFFSAFYNFYESMIPNHEKLINLNRQLVAKKDEYQSNAQRARITKVDSVSSSGSTLFCELIINSTELNLIKDIEFLVHDEPKQGMYQNQGEPKLAMFQNSTTAISIQPSQSNCLLKVTVGTSNGTQVIDEGIRIKDLFNQERDKSYSAENVHFVIKYVLAENETDYYNIKLMNIEEDINANNQNISLLNRSISSMRTVFKTQLPSTTSTNEPVVFKSDGNMIEKEFDIMNNIEEVLAKTTKVSYINWNKISWYLTLAMCPFVFINFFLRFDIISVLFTCAIFGIYYHQIKTIYLKRIVCIVLLSIVIDFIWVFYYLDVWGINLPYEWESETTIRKINIVSGIALIIMKLIIAFCLWKLSLQSQLISINEPLAHFISDKARSKKMQSTRADKMEEKKSIRHVPNKNEKIEGEITIRKQILDSESENEP